MTKWQFLNVNVMTYLCALFVVLGVSVVLGSCKGRSAESVPVAGVDSTLQEAEAIDTVSVEAPSAVSLTFEGDYLDEDNNEPNLHIARRDGDGKYSVEIGIFRLTTLDDGIGSVTGDELIFTATDAAGNPIGGSISLVGDTAVVTFTDSHWELLPNGSEFRYVRDTAPHSEGR